MTALTTTNETNVDIPNLSFWDILILNSIPMGKSQNYI